MDFDALVDKVLFKSQLFSWLFYCFEFVSLKRSN